MAKFCTHCGNEVNENAVVCVKCGCAIEHTNTKNIISTIAENAKKTQISFTLGIIGILFAWIFALVGHIASIIGIIIGIKEYKETEKMTGLVLSIIGEVCSIFSSIIGAVAVSSIF
ncbi:MAG: zinc-ribbon domain-containing protein [Acutalibacteraceae bacterium]